MPANTAPSVDFSRSSTAARLRPVAEDVRCNCGALIARLYGNVCEVKCRRCKEIVQLDAANADAEGAIRCKCRMLLAYATPRGIETKCRRCRQISRIA